MCSVRRRVASLGSCAGASRSDTRARARGTTALPAVSTAGASSPIAETAGRVFSVFGDGAAADQLDALEHAGRLAEARLLGRLAVPRSTGEPGDRDVAALVLQRGRGSARAPSARPALRRRTRRSGPARQRLDDDVDGGHAAQRRRQRRLADLPVAAVGDDDRVGVESSVFAATKCSSAAAARLLLALDDHLDADRRAAAPARAARRRAWRCPTCRRRCRGRRACRRARSARRAASPRRPRARRAGCRSGRRAARVGRAVGRGDVAVHRGRATGDVDQLRVRQAGVDEDRRGRLGRLAHGRRRGSRRTRSTGSAPAAPRSARVAGIAVASSSRRLIQVLSHIPGPELDQVAVRIVYVSGAAGVARRLVSLTSRPLPRRYSTVDS